MKKIGAAVKVLYIEGSVKLLTMDASELTAYRDSSITLQTAWGSL